MNDLFPATLAEQIAEVERELAFRERVYARRVASKQMTQDTADRHMRNMRAVLATLLNIETARQ